jgi:hypothetical protein
MKVILSVPDEGYSRHALSAINLISTFSLQVVSSFDESTRPSSFLLSMYYTYDNFCVTENKYAMHKV